MKPLLSYSLPALLLGLCLGAATVLIIGIEQAPTINPDTHARHIIVGLEDSLSKSINEQARLQTEVAALNEQISRYKAQGKRIKKNALVSRNDFPSILEKADIALSGEDLEKAKRLYYKALNLATNPSEREQAKQGLINTHQHLHDYFLLSRGELHAAMWQLFEIYKLQPDDNITLEIRLLSRDLFASAQEAISHNDVLAAGDQLSSLLELSHMANFNIEDLNGEAVSQISIEEQLQELEQNPDYIQRLDDRATYYLYNGGKIEKAQAFWDFAKVAALDKRRLNNQTFKKQFEMAALLNLSYLKTMNQTHDIKMRLNYIQYAFPSLMKYAPIAAMSRS